MKDNEPFNITTVWEALVHRWKLITVFVLAMLLITVGMLLFVVPKYYRSEAVIVAANPMLTDKSRLLNNNIQQLYSPYGTGDDLNRLYAIAQLDSLHYRLVEEFDLVRYYDTHKAAAKKHAVAKLRNDLQLVKTENDELHIVLFTKNKHLSAKIVNRLVSLVDTTASRLWRIQCTRALDALQGSIASLKMEIHERDSSHLTKSNSNASENYQQLIADLQRYESAAGEYRLALKADAPSLVVLQSAFPSLSADKPNRLLVLVAAAIASLAFAIVAVLVYDRKSH